ncbi:MAG: hypothetical protein V9G19_22690 [Tetrasphaera sp.]
MIPALPREVDTELTRLARRWQQLPLGQALASAPVVRALIETHAALLHPDTPVPDLGPAAIIDQLTVLTTDAVLAGRLSPHAASADLAGLRRALAPAEYEPGVQRTQ